MLAREFPASRVFTSVLDYTLYIVTTLGWEVWIHPYNNTFGWMLAVRCLECISYQFVLFFSQVKLCISHLLRAC